jgi:hypothetical protein
MNLETEEDVDGGPKYAGDTEGDPDGVDHDVYHGVARTLLHFQFDNIT